MRSWRLKKPSFGSGQPQTWKMSEFVRSTSDKSRMRAEALYNIQAIVERHGGTCKVSLEDNVIYIDVPKDREVACAQELEEKMGNACI